MLCTGNIGCRETTDWLKGLSNHFHVVKGDFDENTDFPESKVIQIGNFKIGLIHGHQVVPWGDEEALSNEMRQLDCDILINGHTHEMKISKLDKRYLINPGSTTGAYSPLKKDVVPSFMILEFKEKTVEVYIYQLLANDELKID